jgi:hypothetical protein
MTQSKQHRLWKCMAKKRRKHMERRRGMAEAMDEMIQKAFLSVNGEAFDPAPKNNLH